ncbi:UDP-N-acetylmuramate dehydrogenase [Microbacterium sp. SCN 69-37]|uniref:UDP-N-acetylmuramate dehydrogenase n=1 Tax=Microbacterium sp. SCN 69-37 TaxID=1660115 RepID=UPI00086F5417|nr:UDP-N-acetylmuramate dehydrogenase [Microbacterium sp. SCN 69-37]ODT21882.1 MAG: UDP-N-acetylenolpyruvoylglucosamine reductase [Microbacterium sp. SCN 69-37]
MAEITPVPLADLTTLRVGGTPLRMVEARTRDELISALQEAWSQGEPWLVLGGGSNLLAGDEPFDGTVVLVRTSGIQRVEGAREGHVRLRVEAGHNWDALVEYTAAAGLAGIEAMSGIPGSAGAAPIQNVGAYGQEIVETLVEVELLDEATGEVETVSADALGLGFRTSVLKQHYGRGAERSGVIVSITLELQDVGAGDIPVRGAQLRQALRLAPDAAVSLRWIRETVLATRAAKGMVPDDADPDTHSAGSFFQNAIVSASFARALPPECPRWPMAVEIEPVTVIPLAAFDGVVPPPVSVQPDVKVSAAWLIEHSGLGKGFRLPRSRAGLSTKHALALTNRGGATAGEVAELARYIQHRVQSEFGLLLQPEPVLVGVEL